MKKLLLMVLVSIACLSLLQAQPNLSIVSPTGLDEPPYEVAAGTEVTLRWAEHEGAAPHRFFTFAEDPETGTWTTGPNPAWQSLYNFTDNGDGTYNFKIPINGPIYVWAGMSTGGGSGFIYWQYTQVFRFDVASGVTITSTDGWVCPDAANRERLQITGSYASYQWYLDGEAIPGATSATYDAADPGQYKVQVPKSGNLVFSNSLRVREANVALTGVLASGNKLTMSASEGLTSYQWLSGTSEAALNPIGAATNRTQQITYTATKTYYAVRAVQAGCAVESPARAASTAIFAKPVLTSNADEQENEHGVICTGNIVKLSVEDKYAGYRWLRNGEPWYEGTAENYVSETNLYGVEVSVPEWPEIWRAADPVDIFFHEPTRPELFGVSSFSSHCPGEELSLTLSDNGYKYTWTKHVFGQDPETVVPDESFTYSFVFEGEMQITVKAEDELQGCESQTQVYLQSYAGQQFSLSVSNDALEYLCGAQTQDIFPSEDMSETHDHFQWYTLTNGVYRAVSGRTNPRITVNTAGNYVLRAHPIACADNLIVESFPMEIRDNSSRPLYVETDKTTLCEGEKATLSISGSGWKNIQWFEKTIVNSGPTGHHEVYIPLSGSGSGATTQVSKFTTYQVKANHESCPSGAKATSEPLQIKPTVNPELTIEPAVRVNRWVLAPYDSIADVVFCGIANITVSVPAEYSGYKWFKGRYDGGGNYELGTEVAGQTTDKYNFLPDLNWLTARVVGEGGCVGYSRPLLIDTYVHSSPAVAEQGNGEFCAEGDSVWLANAFPGDNWVKYEWFKDGVPIPDSDNDTIWVKEAGGYNVTGYPEECPTIGYNSGTPARIRMMPTPAVIEVDTAYLPGVEGFAGEFYDIHWYVDEVAYEIPEGQQAFIYKSALVPGNHTLRVEITNPTECTRSSDPYSTAITGIEPGELAGSVRVYPNPTTGRISLHGIHPQAVAQIQVYNAQGVVVQQAASLPTDGLLDLTSSPAGIYIVDVKLKDGSTVKARVARQ